MIIYVAWPTANVGRSNKVAEAWMSMGYRVAVATELPKEAIRGIRASHPPCMIKHFEGYYKTINWMAHELCRTFRADVVIAGADTLMPPTHDRSWAIGATFAARFGSSQGYGVMLPCQEVWAPEIGGGLAQEGAFGQRRMHATPPSDQRCEGAWLGRRFILESCGGAGPFFNDYDQYFGDVELHDTAQRAGVLWKRPDIRQAREHWSRGHLSIERYQEVNFDRAYEKDMALWRARRSKEYPDNAPVSRLFLPEQTGITSTPKIILP